MRKLRLLALGLCLPALLLGAKRDLPSTEWRGELKIQRYNFVYGTGQKYEYGPEGTFAGTKRLVVRRVELWTRDYDLYVGPGGVVREQLTHATGQPSVAPPKGIRLLHYGAGWGLVFDKGGSAAVKGPVTPPTSPRNIGTRTILGFLCEGKQYKWKTWQGATVELETWTPTGSGESVPLLQVEYFTDKAGALLGLTVQFVAKIEPTSNLPESLFEPPKGLHVSAVPFIE